LAATSRAGQCVIARPDPVKLLGQPTGKQLSALEIAVNRWLRRPDQANV